ncbi:MAG: IS30 family transposase [Candidatus Magasanikbacteria bacterium]|nr:IS30 family transposase [Candidatus Magasanikbacteria bacterium]
MKQFKRLSGKEREEISRRLACGEIQAGIARALRRCSSTISREIRGGSCNRYTYRAGKAGRRARRQATSRKSGKRKLAVNESLWRYVVNGLRHQWSPDQIARAIVREYPNDTTMRIAPDTIYTTVYVLPKGALKKELLSCLRREHKRRYKRRSANQPANQRKLADMVLIDKRPPSVNERIVPGHWEGDLLIGKNRQSAMGSLTERTTRTTILVPLKNRTALEVRKAFVRELKKIPKQMRLTLTYDQGREMAEHQLFTKQTKMQVYFAHPGSPWERGTNENTNGLIRQYFPKGTNFSKISRRKIKWAQNRLNGRPRKVLDYQTPYEVFNKLLR